MTEKDIAERLRENGIPFRPEVPEKLETYFRLLLEWNGRMDLVAEAPEDELLDRHFIDSLTILKTDLTAGAENLIDVGTGAGFPGLVLAMACPEIRVTLLDSQQKRLTFLEEVIRQTGTANAATVHARAEDGARNALLREKYDLAAARAVAPLNVLCEYLLPFVKPGGRMVCWKGPGLAEETEAGRKAAFLLGGKLCEAVAAPVAGRDWNHMLLMAEKIRKTPGIYPRKAGTPKKQPLGL